jgi:hypothetical protein
MEQFHIAFFFACLFFLFLLGFALAHIATSILFGSKDGEIVPSPLGNEINQAKHHQVVEDAKLGIKARKKKPASKKKAAKKKATKKKPRKRG